LITGQILLLPLIGLIFVLAVSVAALVTPSVSPYDAYKMQLAEALSTALAGRTSPRLRGRLVAAEAGEGCRQGQGRE